MHRSAAGKSPQPAWIARLSMALRLLRQRLEDNGLINRFRSEAELNEAADQPLSTKAQERRGAGLIAASAAHGAEQQFFFDFGQEGVELDGLFFARPT